MTMQEIIGLISGVLLLAATWWKIFSTNKSFKDVKLELDLARAELKTSIASCVECQRKAEVDIVRLEGVANNMDNEIAQAKADLVRETQIMTNQMSAMHQMIERVDEKYEKLRDRK
jgi:hypothetical protein